MRLAVVSPTTPEANLSVDGPGPGRPSAVPPTACSSRSTRRRPPTPCDVVVVPPRAWDGTLLRSGPAPPPARLAAARVPARLPGLRPGGEREWPPSGSPPACCPLHGRGRAAMDSSTSRPSTRTRSGCSTDRTAPRHQFLAGLARGPRDTALKRNLALLLARRLSAGRRCCSSTTTSGSRCRRAGAGRARSGRGDPLSSPWVRCARSASCRGWGVLGVPRQFGRLLCPS